MIGRLCGILVEKKAPGLVIDVNGVGYEVEAPMTTFYELPKVGEKVTIYTHLVVREDAHLLFGFIKDNDRALFRSLIKVSGVGGKLALALLSGMSSHDFIKTVRSNDIASLTRIPGVGKKTAERLVIEMRDRLKEFVPEKTSWAHLDIAGVTWSDKAKPTRPKGATAFGVRLLNDWIAENYEA